MEKCSVVKSLHSNVREWGGERRRPSAEAEESRASVTLQVGGLWLYPVLMRAAQPRISSSKSIKGANKCRAVTGLPRDHSRPRETRERGREWGRELKPRWWTLAGERDREDLLWRTAVKYELMMSFAKCIANITQSYTVQTEEWRLRLLHTGKNFGF